jgi:hypothetical protein
MRQNLEIENIFFRVILFVPTTLSTGMTGISWHMQWPLTSQSHGSILKANNYFFIRDQTPRPEIENIFAFEIAFCMQAQLGTSKFHSCYF